MRKHITPSVVIALIALTLSLMGVGYAAITLPRDSVGKAQIRAGAVGSAEVADGSLKPIDFSKAALARMAGVAGPKGETGPAGPKGEASGSGSGAGGSDLTVTDANGVVAGTLLSMDHSLNIWVVTPSGKVAQYFSDGTLRSQAFVVSLNADCSPPLYSRTLTAGPIGFAALPQWRTTAYVRSHDAPISPAPSSLVYRADAGDSCISMPADSYESPPSFVRIEPVTDVRLALATPLTFG